MQMVTMTRMLAENKGYEGDDKDDDGDDDDAQDDDKK